TNWLVCEGGELDITVNVGASVRYRWGFNIVSSGAVNGSDPLLGGGNIGQDAAIAVGSAGPGWVRAFSVREVNGQPPIDRSGCLWCDDGAVHTITTGFQSAYTITGNALDFQKFTVGGNGSIVSRGVVGSGAVLTIIEDGVGGSSTTLGASSSFGHSGAVGTLTNHNFGFYTNTQ